MHRLYALEQLASGNTCIHRLHPLVKLLASLIFIVTVVSFDRYAFGRLIPYIFYPILLMALSETPYVMLFKRFLIALPFCLFAGISNILFERTVVFEIGGIPVSSGVISLFTILFRTYLCVMAVLILVSVTPLSKLTGEMRRLRIPHILIVVFEMTYRYLGVLLNEAFSMSLAYSLRSSKKKGIEMRDMGSFAGQLLIRSFDRADRVYNAMKCRGYASGNIPGCFPGYAIRNKPQNTFGVILRDIVFLVIVCVLCVLFRVVDMNSLFTGIAGRIL